jgi:transposase
MSPQPCFVGIDVAHATLDIAVRPTAETWQGPNDGAGIPTLVAQLHAVAPTLMVLEATGGSHGPVTAALATAGLPVVVVNPRQGRAFAQAVGILAKTDRIDARVLAHCAEAVRPALRPLPDAATHELQALVLRRRQRIAMLTAERNRLGTAPARIQEASQRPIPWLEHHGPAWMTT